MKKWCTLFALALYVQGFAQTKIMVPPSRDGLMQQVLNTSELIPVEKGDTFSILPSIDYPPRRHQFLKGLLKTLGAGALAYSTQKTLRPATFGKNLAYSQPAKNWLPSVGIGLAVGMPDIVKGLKNGKGPYLTYLFYTKDKQLISSKTQKWGHKSNRPVTGVVASNGYMQVLLSDRSASPVLANDLEVNIRPLPPTKPKGGIAQQMALATYGECMPDDGGDGGDGNVDLPFGVDNSDADDFFDGFSGQTNDDPNSGFGVITDYDGNGGNAYYLYNEYTDSWILNYWTGEADPKTVGDTGDTSGDITVDPSVSSDDYPNYVGGDASSYFDYIDGDNGYLTDPYGNTVADYQYDPTTDDYYQIPYMAPTPLIRADPSVTNYPIVNCVYNNLMNDNSDNGLKSILGKFNSVTGNNIVIKVVNGLVSNGGWVNGVTYEPHSQNNPTDDYIHQYKWGCSL